jgi:DNA invertase Pin-like site-specific DNA recombinase
MPSVHFELDTQSGTPSGRLMVQIIAAMGEFERSLIQERIGAGIRHARSQGKVLGRPRVFVSENRIEELRASGASWRAITAELRVGLGTVVRAAQRCSKTECIANPLGERPQF